ncbi:MAG: extracellular solute-binding protein [Ruminococcaceae bacterium]|nr:extracellular solute-binding protein [Oscillospiraceae bacterium]
MKRTRLARAFCLFLAVLMATGAFSAFGVSAVGETKTSDNGVVAVEKSSLQQMMEILDVISYYEYAEKYAEIPRAKQPITIQAADYLASETTAAVTVETDYEGSTGKSLATPSDGKVSWEVNIPEDGKYAVKFVYYPTLGKASAIERMMYIDGFIPFAEARSLTATKSWEDVYEGEFGVFVRDINDNQIRPEKAQKPFWTEYVATDSTGYNVNPLEFYFTAGKHVITLESVREPMVLKEITLYPYEDLPTYAEVLAEYEKKGYKEVSADATLHIPAEISSRTSEQTIYPISDRTSPITEPQDASLVRLNTIGAEKWKTVGQWVEYDVDVKESGLYKIVLRFKQSELAGMYTSRKLYINGEVPFEEANYLQFNFDNNWQVKALNDGSQEFLFYLEKGTNTLRFEVVLGHLGEILRRAQDALNMMNTTYTSILKITGSTPDQYRDYDFAALIPDEIGMLGLAAQALRGVSEELVSITGQRGSHVATLDKVFVLLERMYEDEDEIAKNLSNLKTYIGTLGTWLASSISMPLEVDYINLQNSTEALPAANANFFQKMWHEIKAFVMSFFSDYSSLGSTSEEVSGEAVEVWVTTGRERSQILRSLIDNEFTPHSNISVNLKLVAGGILQSTLAGIGPDLATLSSADCISYAIRDAVLPITPHSYEDEEGDDEATKKRNAELREIFSDFNEAIKAFPASSTVPLTLYGETFGLPNTMAFPMLFYRMDIFADLGLEVPRTWDELHAIVPVLQNNYMDVGFPQKLPGLKMFLYQNGGELFADDGKRINLDSNVALTAFEQLCDLFEKYKFPLKYDFPNRFRTGEMPLGIVDYVTNYNQLVVFAPEIEGLWEFTSLPGVEHEDGTIRNVSVTEVTAISMLKGCEGNEKNAWEYMKWYTGATCQSRYSSELVAIVGPSSKYNTANIEALESMPWTSREYSNLMLQFENTVGVPEYPGSYIIDRYVSFAFLDVYNDGADAVESLLDIVTDINKEITRKRKEFHYDYLEFDYSTSAQYIESADGSAETEQAS